MTNVLLISRSRKFESRLRGLVGPDLNAIMGAAIAKGTPAVLARLGQGNAPDVALLGPALSYTQAYELSVGLSRMYPRTRILLVREGSSWDTEKWMSRMNVHGLASPGLPDGALVQVVEGKTVDRGVVAELETDFVAEVFSGAEPAAEPELPEAEVDADSDGFESEIGTEAESAAEADPFPEPQNQFPLEKTDPETPTDQQLQDDSSAEPSAEPYQGGRIDATIPTQATLPLEPVPLYRGQVIAVTSPKGGMGKTTVATNLALGLARIAPHGVVLVDGDVQFGDVATALALDPAYALPDAVSDAAAADDIVLKAYLTLHPFGLFTVCGAASPIDGDRVTGDQLSRLIAQLAGIFRYVVVDTAPGLGEHTLAALEQSTDAVAICGMSVTSARGLRKHLEVLHRIGVMPAGRHVVLNFADRVSGLSVRDVEATTGVPMDVAIPRSQQIVLSSNRGIPIIAEKRRSATSKAFTQLVSRFDPSAVRNHARHLRTVALK